MREGDEWRRAPNFFTKKKTCDLEKNEKSVQQIENVSSLFVSENNGLSVGYRRILFALWKCIICLGVEQNFRGVIIDGRGLRVGEEARVVFSPDCLTVAIPSRHANFPTSSLFMRLSAAKLTFSWAMKVYFLTEKQAKHWYLKYKWYKRMFIVTGRLYIVPFLKTPRREVSDVGDATSGFHWWWFSPGWEMESQPWNKRF